MSTAIDEKTVRHVAKLAALALSDSDVEKTRRELNDILEYVNRLSQVNTNNIEPTSHVHGVVNVFREDVIQDSLPLSALKEMAPAFGTGGFRVPKIIG